MAIWSRIRRRLARDRTGRHLVERDAPAEPGTARTRATGGVHKPDAPDTHSTTGTTPSGTFVGRAGGDDPGNLEGPGERPATPGTPEDEDERRPG